MAKKSAIVELLIVEAVAPERSATQDPLGSIEILAEIAL